MRMPPPSPRLPPPRKKQPIKAAHNSMTSSKKPQIQKVRPRRASPTRAVKQSTVEKRAENKNADDGTEATNSNSLASFLADSQNTGLDAPGLPISQISSSILRISSHDSASAIEALNLFIYQAGKIHHGRGKPTTDEEAQLRHAAAQVGLSRAVVDALIRQTSDSNAVIKYCMTSNDTFAKKIKEDPNISGMLNPSLSRKRKSGFNLVDSIWRILMMKVVQQFLKEHGLSLADVLEKSSLTSSLYREAIRSEYSKFEKQEELLDRDFTRERMSVQISEKEAEVARQRANASADLQHAGSASEDEQRRITEILLREHSSRDRNIQPLSKEDVERARLKAFQDAGFEHVGGPSEEEQRRIQEIMVCGMGDQSRPSDILLETDMHIMKAIPISRYSTSEHSYGVQPNGLTAVGEASESVGVRHSADVDENDSCVDLQRISTKVQHAKSEKGFGEPDTKAGQHSSKEVSAVKRGLAIFENSAIKNDDKRTKRKVSHLRSPSVTSSSSQASQKRFSVASAVSKFEDPSSDRKQSLVTRDPSVLRNHHDTGKHLSEVLAGAGSNALPEVCNTPKGSDEPEMTELDTQLLPSTRIVLSEKSKFSTFNARHKHSSVAGTRNMSTCPSADKETDHSLPPDVMKENRPVGNSVKSVTVGSYYSEINPAGDENASFITSPSRTNEASHESRVSSGGESNTLLVAEEGKVFLDLYDKDSHLRDRRRESSSLDMCLSPQISHAQFGRKSSDQEADASEDIWVPTDGVLDGIPNSPRSDDAMLSEQPPVVLGSIVACPQKEDSKRDLWSVDHSSDESSDGFRIIRKEPVQLEISNEKLLSTTRQFTSFKRSCDQSDSTTASIESRYLRRRRRSKPVRSRKKEFSNRKDPPRSRRPRTLVKKSKNDGTTKPMEREPSTGKKKKKMAAELHENLPHDTLQTSPLANDLPRLAGDLSHQTSAPGNNTLIKPLIASPNAKIRTSTALTNAEAEKNNGSVTEDSSIKSALGMFGQSDIDRSMVFASMALTPHAKDLCQERRIAPLEPSKHDAKRGYHERPTRNAYELKENDPLASSPVTQQSPTRTTPEQHTPPNEDSCAHHVHTDAPITSFSSSDDQALDKYTRAKPADDQYCPEDRREVPRLPGKKGVEYRDYTRQYAQQKLRNPSDPSNITQTASTTSDASEHDDWSPGAWVDQSRSANHTEEGAFVQELADGGSLDLSIGMSASSQSDTNGLNTLHERQKELLFDPLLQPSVSDLVGKKVRKNFEENQGYQGGNAATPNLTLSTDHEGKTQDSDSFMEFLPTNPEDSLANIEDPTAVSHLPPERNKRSQESNRFANGSLYVPTMGRFGALDKLEERASTDLSPGLGKQSQKNSADSTDWDPFQASHDFEKFLSSYSASTKPSMNSDFLATSSGHDNQSFVGRREHGAYLESLEHDSNETETSSDHRDLQSPPKEAGSVDGNDETLLMSQRDTPVLSHSRRKAKTKKRRKSTPRKPARTPASVSWLTPSCNSTMRESSRCFGSPASDPTLDEAEIRASARKSGVPRSVVDVILSQARAQKSTSGVDVVGEEKEKKGPTKSILKKEDPSTSHTFGNLNGRSWDTEHAVKMKGSDETPSEIIEQDDSESFFPDYRKNRMDPSEAQELPFARDPSPLATPYVSGPRETDDMVDDTAKQVELLNRFIEVSAMNFEGKKLSDKSEAAVRAAAAKLGLSEVLIDQLIDQARERNRVRQESSGETINVPQTGQSASRVPRSVGLNEFAGPRTPAGTITEPYSPGTFGPDTATMRDPRSPHEAKQQGCQVWETVTQTLAYLVNPMSCYTTDDTLSLDGSFSENRPPKRKYV